MRKIAILTWLVLLTAALASGCTGTDPEDRPEAVDTSDDVSKIHEDQPLGSIQAERIRLIDVYQGAYADPMQLGTIKDAVAIARIARSLENAKRLTGPVPAVGATCRLILVYEDGSSETFGYWGAPFRMAETESNDRMYALSEEDVERIDGVLPKIK